MLSMNNLCAVHVRMRRIRQHFVHFGFSNANRRGTAILEYNKTYGVRFSENHNFDSISILNISTMFYENASACSVIFLSNNGNKS